MGKNNYKVIVILFFAVYLLLGISIFRDYGISWDEPSQRTIGLTSYYKYIDKNVVIEDVPEYVELHKYYGPVFEILLVFIERMLGISKDPRFVFFMRHLVTFLLFYISIIFFYLLCKDRFSSWKMGLAGCLFLVLSPKIFGHSFYNSKDIPLLSMFIICVYTLTKYLEKKSMARAFFHALSCSILFDMRVLGILIPFLTIVYFLAELFIVKTTGIKEKKTIINFLLYIFLFVFFSVIFWPTSWEKPLYYFSKTFSVMKSFPYPWIVLYMGKYIKASELPWHYVCVWILISTPLLYSICFFIGSLATIAALVKNPLAFCMKRRADCIFLAWFFAPLAMVIIFKSALYDSWRQMYFIYPAFLMFSLIGLNFAYHIFGKWLPALKQNIRLALFILIIAASLGNVVWFMVKYHPYQDLYFNILAGKNMQEVKTRFDLDYWGLSYRKALEYILKHDKEINIKIYVANHPGRYNSLILPENDRARLFYVQDLKDAKYFLTEYRYHKEEFPDDKEFYSIKIDGAKIMAVFKLR